MSHFIIFYEINLLFVQVLATACAAAVHRRHLMVWKIFAPRFIFEAASFLVVSAVLLLVLLVVLWIDRAVARVTKTLVPEEPLQETESTTS